MIGPQEQMSGSLTITELTKIYFLENLFILKEVFRFLPMSHGTLTTIRCTCDKILSLEYWSKHLHQRRDIKRSD